MEYLYCFTLDHILYSNFKKEFEVSTCSGVVVESVCS